MTTQEHKLMISMFTKIYESFGVIASTLTSRGIWTDDDAKAFASAVRFDRAKMENFADRASAEYLQFAIQLGVEVDLT